MKKRHSKVDLTADEGVQFTLPINTQDVPPWEEVEEGRYMPRRVRGSYQGRALG